MIIPYHISETIGNLDVTYYGTGILEMKYFDGGKEQTLILALQDLDRITRTAKQHARAYADQCSTD